MWKKSLQYLGLVEDDELEDIEEGTDFPGRGESTTTVRRIGRTDVTAVDRPETIVRTMPSSRGPIAGSIHRAEPKRFNEARDLGDKFREGVPVIINLQGCEDATARRLVDFASGLVFGLGGKIETVANRVYLLTPANVEVSAEERERLREGGFYNQF